MNKKEPLVTVIVPSYNHELYIKECLKEVVAISKYIDINILIIDDGSTDNTPAIIKDFIFNQDMPIEFIEKENAGLVSSLNLGIRKIKTEYIYLVASDDIPCPEEVSKCVNKLCMTPRLKFIICGARNIFIDQPDSNVYRESHEHFFANSDKTIRRELFFDYPKPLLLQSTVFKTDAIRSVGYWDDDVVLDDYAMFIKLLSKYEQHKDYLFEPQAIICKYRHHESNSSKNYLRQYLMVKQVICKYAQSSLKYKAIGYRLGFYMMLCIKDKKLSVLRVLMRNSSKHELLWGFIAIPKIYYKYINKSL